MEMEAAVQSPNDASRSCVVQDLHYLHHRIDVAKILQCRIQRQTLLTVSVPLILVWTCPILTRQYCCEMEAQTRTCSIVYVAVALNAAS